MNYLGPYISALLSMLESMSPYLLLGFLVAGVLHAFVPPRLYSRYLSGTGMRPVALAALLGIPLPLCSCGVLPTAVSLRRNGASCAASTSFLIATPQTGVDSIAATYSMMGLPFALLRPLAALVTALAGGTMTGALERRGLLHAPAVGNGNATVDTNESRTLWQKTCQALRYGLLDMMQSIGRWLLLGLLVAALITVLVPDDFFTSSMDNHLLNMVLVLAIAVPMYICATGSIPIAAALMLKGLSPGCALVLLMAGPAANVASMLVVSHAMGRRATAAYLVTIIAGAMGFGLAIDLIPSVADVFTGAMPPLSGHSSRLPLWFNHVCSVVVALMIVAGITARYTGLMKTDTTKPDNMKEYKVKGMMCVHCKAAVEKGLAALPGVESVTVDLARGTATIEGNVDDETVKTAIRNLGYETE